MISNDEFNKYEELIAQQQFFKACEPGDPVLVIFWNEIRLQQLAAQHPNPKQQIITEIVQNGGEQMQPFPERFFFFREASVLVECREQLKNSIPWAFSAGPQTAAILNVPAGVPVAESAIIYKTEHVKPDMSKSDFFLA